MLHPSWVVSLDSRLGGNERTGVNLVRLRKRGGSPISRERLIRLGAAALTGLRMLILNRQELRNERRVPVFGLALGLRGTGREHNEGATLIGRRCAIRFGLAIGRVRLLQRCCDSFKPHSNTVPIQDNEPLSTLYGAKGVPGAR